MFSRILKELAGILGAVLVFFAVLGVFLWFSFGVAPHLLYKNTTDFSGKVAKDFYIALVELDTTNNKDKYSFRRLSDIESNPPDLSAYSYILPDTYSKIPSKGDTYYFKVLEVDAGMQLIEFSYGNTHSSWSVYRAFQDKIVPVSHRTDDPGLLIIMFILGIIAGHFIAGRSRRWMKRKLGIIEQST